MAFTEEERFKVKEAHEAMLSLVVFRENHSGILFYTWLIIKTQTCDITDVRQDKALRFFL